MLVVWQWRQHGGPDTGTSLPPLWQMKSPLVDALEGGVEGNAMESRQMSTHASFWAALYGEV